MPEEEAERTEPATPKKREDARRKGDVAQSREVQSVVILATALLVLGSELGGKLLRSLASLARAAWSHAAHPPESLADFHSVILGKAAPPALAVLPILLLLAAAGVLAQLVQTGPLLSLEALAFQGSRLNPLKGIKRMVSGERLFDLVKSILKVVVVCIAGWAVIGSEMEAIVGLADVGIGPGLQHLGELARRLAVAALSVLALMAIGDLLFQRFLYEKKLRMSKREVREEARQREGDPHIRSRFRQMQRDLSRSRMIAAVADADVVITNPTHYAVALAYQQSEMAAPEVVAKGRGHVALRIREAAEAADVPIVENPPLARTLHQTTEVGREVPEKLFQAIAEVLAYVYRIDPRRARRWGALS